METSAALVINNQINSGVRFSRFRAHCDSGACRKEKNIAGCSRSEIEAEKGTDNEFGEGCWYAGRESGRPMQSVMHDIIAV